MMLFLHKKITNLCHGNIVKWRWLCIIWFTFKQILFLELRNQDWKHKKKHNTEKAEGVQSFFKTGLPYLQLYNFIHDFYSLTKKLNFIFIFQGISRWLQFITRIISQSSHTKILKWKIILSIVYWCFLLNEIFHSRNFCCCIMLFAKNKYKKWMKENIFISFTFYNLLRLDLIVKKWNLNGNFLLLLALNDCLFMFVSIHSSIDGCSLY